MRLAILSMHTDPLAPLGGDLTGGMNVYVREIAKALAARGVAVDVFTRLESESAAREVAIAPGARLLRIPAGKPAMLDKDAQHALVEAFAQGILASAQQTGARYDGVSAHYWLSGLAGERLAGRWGVPLAVRFHTLAARKNAALPVGARGESATRLAAEAALARAADAIFVSSASEAHAIGETPGICRVVPCGVDLETFRPHPKEQARARLGLAPGAACVLGVGRIEPVKGLDRLIRAFAAVCAQMPGREAHLLHVGGETRAGAAGPKLCPEDFASPAQGAEVARLMRLARAYGVGERVTFLGAKPQDALPVYYSAADLFALPSRYESFGIAALEAAACGLPTLAFDVGGVASSVGEGESGHLIPEGDLPAYGRKMREMLDAPRLRPRAWAEAFAWPRVAEAELDVWGVLREAALPSRHA